MGREVGLWLSANRFITPVGGSEQETVLQAHWTFQAYEKQSRSYQEGRFGFVMPRI
jgi:hypothetical protein